MKGMSMTVIVMLARCVLQDVRRACLTEIRYSSLLKGTNLSAYHALTSFFFVCLSGCSRSLGAPRNPLAGADRIGLPSCSMLWNLDPTGSLTHFTAESCSYDSSSSPISISCSPPLWSRSISTRHCRAYSTHRASSEGDSY